MVVTVLLSYDGQLWRERPDGLVDLWLDGRWQPPVGPLARWEEFHHMRPVGGPADGRAA
jgi:hypothetical protein